MDTVPWQDLFDHHLGAISILDADLQPSILNHIDADVRLPRLEYMLSLLQLHKDHVFTKFQE